MSATGTASFDYHVWRFVDVETSVCVDCGCYRHTYAFGRKGYRFPGGIESRREPACVPLRDEKCEARA
jgi:hypothetical protein